MADTQADSTVAAARRRVIKHFTDQGATATEYAVAYSPIPGIDERQFYRLTHMGVIVETGDGRYWYDKPMEDEVRGKNRQRTVIGVGVGLAGAAALGALMWYRRRGR